jgi:hypothetical protein
LVSWKWTDILRKWRLSWLGHLRASRPQQSSVKTKRIVGKISLFFPYPFLAFKKQLSCYFSFAIFPCSVSSFPLFLRFHISCY